MPRVKPPWMPDIEAVTAFLEGRFEGVRDIEAFGGGEWSSAFGFRSGEQDYVARFGQYRVDYEKDRVASRYAGPALPIPAVIEVGEAFDGAYAVSERLFGDPLDQLSEAGFRRALPSVLGMLDALRLADVSWASGYGMWGTDGAAPHASWRDFLLGVRDFDGEPAGRVAGWWDLLRSRPGAEAAFEAGYSELEALAAGVPEDRHLLHTDFVGDNVRVLGDRVTAVVDWGNAAYGDFLYDLARFDFWRPWYPDWGAVDVIAAARDYFREHDIEVSEFDARLRCYELHIGLDAQAYDAFTQRWDELERSAARTLEVARRG